ncbi:metallopeptidase family protein [Dinoroseobacter sp. S124A]|uniref:metallopeptidase family protein n=1 Tax=Dinoroseobacter sp. S124A TaxID=3415128 RepID=UPI003C7A761D
MSDRAPDLTAFLQMARATVAEFPAPFAALAAEVSIVIEEMPQDWMLDDLDIPDPLDLTGLYDGVPLTEKSVFDQPMQPDTVWLFRQPILAEWREREGVRLPDLIAHVTVHEFAHHFGWSDEDIAAIDRWWE